MRSPARLTFPLQVVRDSAQPLPEQIAGQVALAIERGWLASDSRLPSTRTLAELLRVSRGVTTAAYDLLYARGHLRMRPGSGAYATGCPAASGTSPGRRAGAVTVPVDLRPGLANADLVPLPAWRAAWREATFRRPPAGPVPELGLPRLRAAVAAHLCGVPEVRTADRTVVITSGITRGLRSILAATGLGGTVLGDFRELLGPELPVGYALTRPDLADHLGRQVADHREQPSYVAQVAVATLLCDGTVDRVTRRLDRLRAERSRLVESTLGDLCANAAATGTAAIRLPPHADAERLAEQLLANGVRVSAQATPPALLFGYLSPADADLRRALSTIRAVVGGGGKPPW